MTDRTVYILGRVLGKMVKAFNADASSILANAYHNPMREITVLHLNHMDMPKELVKYIGKMLNQIDGAEDATGNIYPQQQSALSIGFTMGTVPFEWQNELSDRRITQQALADKLGVNRVTVARWVENGAPKNRLIDIELAIYSLSGIIGNGYEYINFDETPEKSPEE